MIYLFSDIIITSFSFTLPILTVKDFLGLESFSIVTIYLSIIIVLFYIIAFFVYKQHMNSIMASLLYFISLYLQYFCYIGLGISFGANILWYLYFDNPYLLAFALILSICFFFLLFVTYFIINVTDYSIFIKKSLFSYFRYPIRTYDILTIFIISSLIPYRFFTYGAPRTNSILVNTIRSQATITEIQQPFRICFTIGSVYLFIYGILKVVFIFRKPSFANGLCLMIQCKYALDCIISSIRTPIDIWNNLSSQIAFFVFPIIFGMNFVLAFIITYFIGFNYRKKFEDSTAAISKLSSKDNTVTILRLSFIFQFSHIITFDFLQWIAKWQSSPELIAEIIRICITQKFPIHEINTSNLTMNSYTLLKMKFVAYQFNKYVFPLSPLHRKSGVKHKTIDTKIKLVQAQQVLAKDLFDSFWDSTAINQMNFLDFFDQITQIAHQIHQIQVEIPNNQEIRNLFNNFQNEFIPSKMNELPYISRPKLLFSSFNLIYKYVDFEVEQETTDNTHRLIQTVDNFQSNKSLEQATRKNNFNTVDRPVAKPKKNSHAESIPYSKNQFNTTNLGSKKFLNTSQFLFDYSNDSDFTDGSSNRTFSNKTSNSNLTVKSRESHTTEFSDVSDTSLELFLNKITYLYSYPLFIFFILFYFVFVIIIIIIQHRTFRRTRANANLFYNMSLFLSMQPHLMGAKLSMVDRNVVFPSQKELSKLLGTDEETTSAYVSYRITITEKFHNLTQYFSYFNYSPDDFPSSIKNEENSSHKCNYHSFAFLLKSNAAITKESIYCRIRYLNLYSAYISNITSHIYRNVLPVQFRTPHTNQIILIVFLLISIILFIAFLINDIMKMKRIIICTKSLTNNELIYHENHNFLMKTSVLNILGFVFIISFSLLILALIDIPQANNAEHIHKLLSQIVCMSGLLRYSQESLVAAAIPFAQSIDVPMEDLGPSELPGQKSPEKLISLLTIFNTISLDPFFKEIYPLNIWGVNGSMNLTGRYQTNPKRSYRQRSQDQVFSSYEMTSQSFSSLLLDYAQLLLNGESATPYDFYYGRLIYIFNIHPVLYTTLNQMISAATNHIQLYSFNFLVQSSLLSALILLTVLLMIALFSKKKAWYNGATILLRYAAKKNQENALAIRRNLSNSNQNDMNSFYLDELNFGIVVKNNKNGRILAANTKAEDYASQPIQYSQMIGQKFTSIFKKKEYQNSQVYEGNDPSYDIDTSLILLKEKDKDYKNADRYQTFLNNMQISIGQYHHFPVRDNFILIKMRFNTETNLELIDPNILDILDEDISFSIYRLEVGIGFYIGISSFSNSPNVVEFIKLVEKTAISISNGSKLTDSLLIQHIENTNDSQNFIIICATYGQCTLIADDDESNVILCGNSNQRQNELLLRASWGRIYVDMSIVQNSTDVPPGWLIISPLVSTSVQ